jgi:hypothetical protein
VGVNAYTRALIDSLDNPRKLALLNATVRAMRLAEQQLASQYRWTPYRAYVKAMRGNT